jgi:hypothetical protein
MADLTVEITRLVDAGTSRTDVTVLLANPAGGRSMVEIEPLRRLIGYAAMLSGVPYRNTLRTPLAGPRHDLDLVVDLEGSVDGNGAVTFSPPRTWLDGRRSPCAPPPNSPPQRPITLGPSASTPA